MLVRLVVREPSRMRHAVPSCGIRIGTGQATMARAGPAGAARLLADGFARPGDRYQVRPRC